MEREDEEKVFVFEGGGKFIGGEAGVEGSVVGKVETHVGAEDEFDDEGADGGVVLDHEVAKNLGLSAGEYDVEGNSSVVVLKD